MTNRQALLIGMVIGAAAAYYLANSKDKPKRDKKHPHLPAMPSIEEQRERISDTASKLGKARKQLV